VSSVPRFGAEPPLRAQRRPTPTPQWSTSWRNNHRYDWSDWRRRHRSIYRLHRYHDPFGWAYQLFSIGWRIWPNYYSSSYWINDPWMYRLPPAPPGTRWIRYYNDALLVDMWSGEVIDVIHNFFW
jgi:Ni/Co efflux regulator RcnB